MNPLSKKKFPLLSFMHQVSHLNSSAVNSFIKFNGIFIKQLSKYFPLCHFGWKGSHTKTHTAGHVRNISICKDRLKKTHTFSIVPFAKGNRKTVRAALKRPPVIISLNFHIVHQHCCGLTVLIKPD